MQYSCFYRGPCSYQLLYSAMSDYIDPMHVYSNHTSVDLDMPTSPSCALMHAHILTFQHMEISIGYKPANFQEVTKEQYTPILQHTHDCTTCQAMKAGKSGRGINPPDTITANATRSTTEYISSFATPLRLLLTC